MRAQSGREVLCSIASAHGFVNILPISTLCSEDGRQVQYFERVWLELYPELHGTAYLLVLQGEAKQPLFYLAATPSSRSSRSA